jgi:ABC-type Zn uptake system ZnuABC Zn-binding protein ZnuA
MTRLFARPLSTLSLLGLIALLAACGAQTPAAAPAQPPGGSGAPLKAIATFSVLGDLVQNVAGDHVSLTTLVGPGGDAHTYEPTPRDSAALAEASVVFENGLGFEGWIDDLYAASGSRATRVVASAGMTPLITTAAGEHDPHIWHSVSNTIVIVEAIRDALKTADAANASAYDTNAAAYITQLQELDAFIRQEVASIPEGRRKLVTTHDTFAYFADAYGMTVVGTALGVTTEASDPAAGELARLVEEVRAAGVPAIFAENVSNTALMETIAREAGVTLAPPLFTDALGEAGSEGASYLAMMRYNATTIAQALAGQA